MDLVVSRHKRSFRQPVSYTHLDVYKRQEHGFDKKEVRQWVNRQFSRYRKDGYGYFALVLKDGSKLIGQAGLMRSVINGDGAVELGYILDNAYWHNGYATEAARRCLRYAFEAVSYTHLDVYKRQPLNWLTTWMRKWHNPSRHRNRCV